MKQSKYRCEKIIKDFLLPHSKFVILPKFKQRKITFKSPPSFLKNREPKHEIWPFSIGNISKLYKLLKNYIGYNLRAIWLKLVM